MQSEIDHIRRQAESELTGVNTPEQVEAFRILYLARKGLIASLFEQLKSVPPSDRPGVGKQLNELRSRIQSLYDEKQCRQTAGASKDPSLDLTLPGRHRFTGSRHILTQTLDQIKAIFGSMGFVVADGPEIEDDYHNFEALNFPPDHPARDMQDTFFLGNNELLRTHTSPMQIRVMEHQAPPVRVIIPGKVPQ